MSFHSGSYGDIWNQIILGVRDKPLHETTEVGVLSYTIENNFKKNKKIRTAVTLLQYVDSGKKKFYGSEA